MHNAQQLFHKFSFLTILSNTLVKIASLAANTYLLRTILPETLFEFKTKYDVLYSIVLLSFCVSFRRTVIKYNISANSSLFSFSFVLLVSVLLITIIISEYVQYSSIVALLLLSTSMTLEYCSELAITDAIVNLQDLTVLKAGNILRYTEIGVKTIILAFIITPTSLVIPHLVAAFVYSAYLLPQLKHKFIFQISTNSDLPAYLAIFASTGANNLLDSLGILLVNLKEPSATGYIFCTEVFFSFIRLIFKPIAEHFFNLISRSNDKTEIKYKFHNLLLISNYFILFFSAYSLSYGNEVVLLVYGNKWQQSIKPIFRLFIAKTVIRIYIEICESNVVGNIYELKEIAAAKWLVLVVTFGVFFTFDDRSVELLVITEIAAGCLISLFLLFKSRTKVGSIIPNLKVVTSVILSALFVCSREVSKPVGLGLTFLSIAVNGLLAIFLDADRLIRSTDLEKQTN